MQHVNHYRFNPNYRIGIDAINDMTGAERSLWVAVLMQAILDSLYHKEVSAGQLTTRFSPRARVFFRQAYVWITAYSPGFLEICERIDVEPKAIVRYVVGHGTVKGFMGAIGGINCDGETARVKAAWLKRRALKAGGM